MGRGPMSQPRYHSNIELFVSLYIQWLQSFGPDVQHIKIPLGSKIRCAGVELAERCYCDKLRALDAAQVDDGSYDDKINIHPMALISLLCLDVCGFFRQREAVLRVAQKRFSPGCSGSRMGVCLIFWTKI
jgi:hypothetical protein